MRSFLVLLLLAVFVPSAAAQVFVGAEVGPDVFLKSEEGRLDALSDDAFAWALSAQLSSSTLYAVFDSTSGEKEILKSLRSGLYRQELITVMLISRKTAVPFSKLAQELDKGGGLRALAGKYGLDLPGLFSEAGEIKAAADLETALFIEAAPVNESTGPFTSGTSSPPGKSP